MKLDGAVKDLQKEKHELEVKLKNVNVALAALTNGTEGDKLYAQDLLYTVLVPSNVLGIEEFAERAGLWRINSGPWMTRAAFEALMDAESR